MGDKIGIDEFGKLDLRVGIVRAAEEHPSADRLLVLHVDLGGEERQLVAGIKLHYRPDDLIGRPVVVVANLEAVSLRGVESQGMVLAAQDGEHVVLLTTERPVTPGSRAR